MSLGSHKDATDSQEPTTEAASDAVANKPSLSSAGDILVSPLVDGIEAFNATNYDLAAARFDAVIGSANASGDAKAKAAYWRAEALLQQEFTSDKIAHFERVTDEYPEHFLAAAAQRRIEALKAYFATFTTE